VNDALVGPRNPTELETMEGLAVLPTHAVYPAFEALEVVSVVKVPAAAADPPMAGGLARYVENPVPLTVLDADKVVKDPAAADEPPMAGGLAK